MANTPFAIKDVMDLTITEIGGSTPVMTVNYLNSCEFSVEGETVFAKKKGNNAIAFAGARTGTLTLNSELADIQWLGMSLGGAVTGENIEVTGAGLNKTYTIAGTFRVKEEGASELKTKYITFHSATPQMNSTISFSSEEVASFALAFDLTVNASDKFISISSTAPASRMEVKK